ncbi:MAG: acyltransferase family protein [Nitrospirales bacterium]
MATEQTGVDPRGSEDLLRNKTVDIAKGLGILLVVFGHNWIVLHEKGELFRVIFSFHVPLFFFLSGIFFKETTSLFSLIRSRQIRYSSHILLF